MTTEHTNTMPNLTAPQPATLAALGLGVAAGCCLGYAAAAHHGLTDIDAVLYYEDADQKVWGYE